VNELKAGNEAVLAENNLTFSELETIDRSSPLASSVFAFAKPEADQPVFGQAKDQNGNIVIVELSKVTADINPAYSTQIGAQLERVGNQQDLTNVLNVLRKNADVEYYIVGQGQ
jgi:peptidyl-prolyl cis-trans isomerase D